MQAVEGGHPQQLGQICYVPLYIMPQATAGGVDMASLQSCAAAMAAGITNPFLSLQLPQSSASSSSAPASPAGHSLAQLHHQAAAAAAAQHLQAQGFPEYRLANFASLLPGAPHAVQSPQTPLQMAPSSAQLAGLSQLAAAYPFQFPNGMQQLFSAAGLQQVHLGADHQPTSSAVTGGEEAAGGSGKKEIKFKYHMSIMPQLAVASNPPKVEIKKKRKPRMRITGRVCTHCGATKTTEWRMGPEGRGTLCNACGLRYRKKLLSDGQKDPNAKISMSMLLNATKKAGKPSGSEAGSGSPPRRSGEESP